MTALQIGALASGLIGYAVVVGIVLARERLGPLNASSWLVLWGAFTLAGEHPQFALAYTVPFITNEGPMQILPHARVHFFMAGVFSIVGLVMLCIIARTLLREGRRAGWYALLFALLFGGLVDIAAEGFIYPHGFPVYGLLGAHVTGFGWEFLYVYIVAWAAALALSFRPVFRPVPAALANQPPYEVKL